MIKSKKIIKRLKKTCALCGRKITATEYWECPKCYWGSR